MRNGPQADQVEGFVQNAFTESAFTDEGDGDAVRAARAAVEPNACRDGQQGALRTVGEEIGGIEVPTAPNSGADPPGVRSDDRRGGKECDSTIRAREWQAE